jgi:hypothetical protein
MDWLQSLVNVFYAPQIAYQQSSALQTRSAACAHRRHSGVTRRGVGASRGGDVSGISIAAARGGDGAARCEIGLRSAARRSALLSKV